MIFNELTYYALFLAPCVAAFHLAAKVAPERLLGVRSLVLTAFGISFFGYYAYVHFGGWKGSLAVWIFVWELAFSRLYRPGSKWCLVGIV